MLYGQKLIARRTHHKPYKRHTDWGWRPDATRATKLASRNVLDKAEIKALVS